MRTLQTFESNITSNVTPSPFKNLLLSPPCIDLLNKRIEQEETLSRIYLAMSLWLNNEGYTGAAKVWKKYSEEELVHADWARVYLLSFGLMPETSAIPSPQQTFTGLVEIINISYTHEVDITLQCKELASQAFAQGDHMLYELALKYLKEQVEELDKMQTWLDKLNTFGTDRIALRLLDNEMS